ncbi:hypothetical protein [Streptomyces sp. NPDC014995]|uniref:imine reductase family protein n=1 Tax=Streptomyces sp. NPDC014995 TaxID=3364936 RepID=UPI0036F50CD2
MIDDGTSPAPDSAVHTHLTAGQHLVHEREFLGVGVELPQFIGALAEREVADGHGGNSCAALSSSSARDHDRHPVRPRPPGRVPTHDDFTDRSRRCPPTSREPPGQRPGGSPLP